MSIMVSGPSTPVWTALQGHLQRLQTRHTRDLVAADPERFAGFSREAVGLLYDFTRQHLDRGALADLIALADAVRLRERIEAMFLGEQVNVTEDRAVLHVALRQPPGAGLGGNEIARTVLAERERMLVFADSVRTGRIVGSTQRRFERVVNIGIGGSDLGPAMAVEALRPFTQ